MSIGPAGTDLWTDVVSWTLKSAAAALRLFTAGFQLCVFAISHLSPSLAASCGPGLRDAPPGDEFGPLSQSVVLSLAGVWRCCSASVTAEF